MMVEKSTARKNVLQLFSLEARKEMLEAQEVYVLKIPNSLKRFMQVYCQDKEKRWNVSAIRKVISMNFPGIMYTLAELRNIERANDIWIVGVQDIDVEIVKAHTIRWLKIEYKNKFGKELDWDFSEDWGICEKHSLSELYDYENLMYPLLAKYYAYKCSAEPIYMRCLNRELEFNMVMDDNAEAIAFTKPIYLEKDADKKWQVKLKPTKEKKVKRKNPFSYYLEFITVKNIDQNCYCINVSLHTRIWQMGSFFNKDINYILGKENTNLFIFKEGLFCNSNRKNYQAISIKRTNDDLKWWVPNSADRYFLEIEKIDLASVFEQETAERLIDKGHVFITSKKKECNIKRGAGLPERYEIWQKVVEICSELSPRSELICVTNKKPVKFTKPIYRGGSKIVRINIVIDDLNIRETVKNELAKILQIEKLEDNFNYFGKEVKIRFLAESFCDELTGSDDVLLRQNEIKEQFQDVSEDTLELTLINLPNYKERYELLAKKNKSLKNKSIDKSKDPKQLIRNTLAKMGVITQFVDIGLSGDNDNKKLLSKDNKVLPSKIHNALFDLLYAGGFLHKEVLEESGLFRNDVDCFFGVGKIYDQKNNTRIAATLIDRNGIKIRYYSPNSSEKWMELQEIYKSDKEFLEKIIVKGKKAIVSDEISRWIKENLNELLKTHNKIMFFADYSLRNNCNDYRNNPFDKIHENYHGIGFDRIVFIRINDSNKEVPTYNIITDKKTINRNKGLYALSETSNTFYYAPARGNFVQVAIGATKIDLPNSFIPKKRAIEISIRSKEDDVKKYADVVVALMKASLTGQPETTMPLPLHVLKHISNYILAEYETSNILERKTCSDSNEMSDEELLEAE